MDKMMTYFFDSFENKEKLYIELEEWLYTPYKHRCGVKGKGVDCIHLVGCSISNIGVKVNWDNMISYPNDWHIHSSKELLLEGIVSSVNVEVLWDIKYGTQFNVNSIIDGDILLYRFGKASAHAAIYSKNRLYQALLNMKVNKTEVMDSLWFKRITHHIRVLK